MKSQMKNFLLLGLLLLLVSACVPVDSVSVPAEAPEPTAIVKEIPTSIPTSVPVVEVPTFIDPGDYIGLIYPPFPDDLTKGFSMIIQDSDDNGLSFVSDGTGKMLWLEKISRYDENGSPFWEVTDVLDLSSIESGAVLIPDGCFLNGTPDHEIFVVAKNETILLAWRANTASDSFEVLVANGIRCNSDKGMLFE